MNLLLLRATHVHTVVDMIATVATVGKLTTDTPVAGAMGADAG